MHKNKYKNSNLSLQTPLKVQTEFLIKKRNKTKK